MLLAGPAGSVLIEPDGTTHEYNASGQLTGITSLPAEVVQSAVDAVVAARGHEPGPDQPLLTAGSINAAGEMVGMVVGRPAGAVGFLRDAAGTYRPIVRGTMGEADEDALLGSVGVATVGDTLFVASAYGVRAFELRPGS